MNKNSESPITYANVELTLYHGAEANVANQLRPIVLRDDGIIPDFVANDGIYSAIVDEFAPDPSYHHGSLSIELSNGKQIISLADTNPAALLDPLYNSKCCGSSVPSSIQPFEIPSITVLIPGFKTGESFSSENVPPRQISLITVLSNDGSELTLSFISPYSSNDVQRYELCCNIDIDDPTNMDSCIPFTNCDPVGPGAEQECVLTHEMILQGFDAQLGETYFRPVTLFLQCGMRAVTQAGIVGPLSGNLIEVEVRYEPTKEVVTEIIREKSTCSSISDDCLPIWAFWLMLGLLLFLAVLIIILIIVFLKCVSKRGTNGNKKQRPEISQSQRSEVKAKNIQGSKNLEPVFVQSAGNEITSTTEQGPTSAHNYGENNSFDNGFQSRKNGPVAAMSSNEMIGDMNNNAPLGRNHTQDFRNNKETTTSHYSPSLPHQQHRDNLDRTTYPNQQANYNYPPGEDTSNNNNNTQPASASNNSHYAQSNNMILNRFGAQPTTVAHEIPKPRDRTSKSNLGNIPNNDYGNSSFPPPLPTVPSVKPVTGSPERNEESVLFHTPSTTKQNQPPIYATVNRTGRQGRPLVGLADLPQTPVYSSPVFKTRGPQLDPVDYSPRKIHEIRSIQRSHNQNVLFDDDDTTTINSDSTLVGPVSKSRFDAFPSSDSDTYSDMSRGVVIPLPPPLPSSLPPLRSASNINFIGVNDMRIPAGNSQFYDARYSKQQNLQITPSRLYNNNRMVKGGQENKGRMNEPMGGSVPPPPQGFDESSEEYDDDSEHWDDDMEDFEGSGAYPSHSNA